MNKLARSLIFTVLIFSHGYVRALDPVSGNVVTKFRPVNVSIACTPETPSTYRVNYARSEGATPYVTTTSCIDLRASITYIYPRAAEVVFVTEKKRWAVCLYLNDRDTSRVKSLMANNPGKAMLVGADKKILAAFLFQAPIQTNLIYIGSDTEESSHALLKGFEG